MTGFFLSFCSHLPLKLNHYLGSFIGHLLYLFNTDAKKVTLQNIAICFSELSINEQRIMDLLLDKEMHIDAIVEGLEWSFSKVANELLQAEFKGLILSLPGKVYKKNI